MLSFGQLSRLSICNLEFIVDHRGVILLFPSVVIILLQFNLFIKLPTLIPLCSHRATAVQLSCVSLVQGSWSYLGSFNSSHIYLVSKYTRSLELLFGFLMRYSLKKLKTMS